MTKKEHEELEVVYKHSNWILFCCFVVAGLLNYLLIKHL